MAKVSYFDGSEFRLFRGIADVVKDRGSLPSGIASYTTTLHNPANENLAGFIIYSPMYSFANMFSAVNNNTDRIVTQAHFARAFPFDCLFVFAPVQQPGTAQQPNSDKYGFVGCGAATKGSHYATIAGIANVAADSWQGTYSGQHSWIDLHRNQEVKVAVYCFPMEAQYATGITEIKLDE